MGKTKQLPNHIERHTTGVPCDCGGYAAEAKLTNEEEVKYGCGRFRCCACAFVCRICGTRWVGRREAPEME